MKNDFSLNIEKYFISEKEFSEEFINANNEKNGIFLRVNKVNKIPYEKFEILIKKNDYTSIEIEDHDIPIGVSMPKPEKKQKQDAPVVNFLLNNSGFNPVLDITKCNRIFIISNDPLVLSLDWELHFSDFLIIRKVPTKVHLPDKLDRMNKLLLIASTSKESDDLLNGIGEESAKLIVLDWAQIEPKYALISNIDIIKHINKTDYGKLDFSSYNYLHIIMHGTKNGHLFFDCDNINDIINRKTEPVSHDDFINGLSGKFNLVFLSLCYSASGSSNLAFKVINNNKTNFTIAYKDKLGSDKSAPAFVKYFYEQLLQGMNNRSSENIFNAYEKAIDNYKRDKYANDVDYWPLLYSSLNAS